jgi:hypothetical protein
MTFALFQLNWIEFVGVFGLLLLGSVGVGIFLLSVRQTNRRRSSLSQREELERLRDDYERACDRIARLEEEVRQLRRVPPVPGESRFTPSE